MTRRKRCQVCKRLEGSTKNIVGEEDRVPLGPVVRCPLCGLRACPDCFEEGDCCFLGKPEDRRPDGYIPFGWRRVDEHTFERIDP